jgi:uncharacterized protein
MNSTIIDQTADAETPTVLPTPSTSMDRLQELADRHGGPYVEPAEYSGSIGRTLFDSMQSQDGTVTVVLPKEDIDRVPSQSLLRIKSMPDGREFTGIVSAGPFAEPDGLSPQSPSLVISAVNKAMMMPSYHGRMQVSLMTELLDGRQAAPRHRPKPNSPVWTVPDDEMSAILNIHGDVRLGVVDGHETIPVLLPARDKSVLPRHTAMLGTTGGGKSTTVATTIGELQEHGVSIVLFDTEGEYTTVHQPTTNAGLLEALRHRGLPPKGLTDTHVYHLVNRDCANPKHPSISKFTLRFSNLSPWALKEIMELSDAQEERLFVAYEAAKKMLAKNKTFPDPSNPQHARIAGDNDEFTEGWPHLTLYQLLYCACACLAVTDKKGDEAPQMPPPPSWNWTDLKAIVNAMQPPKHGPSWMALIGRLGRLNRLKIFDQACPDIDYATMLQPGRVSIIDLSDLDNYSLRNLAIAELLRGVQQQQETAYLVAAQAGGTPTPVNIMIEEAHEFLSAHRISKMPIIREQLERIARRGRKRYLGLTFITQMPQHLPDEMLALVNNWVIHKIADESVVRRLQKVVQNVDPGIWSRVPSLAPGQALVSLTHIRKALLTLIDPAPCELRMAD